MEVQDLREFITDKFALHDRILDERFKNIDLQFETIKDYQIDNQENHKELQDAIKEVQRELGNLKTAEVAAKERQNASQELAHYKEKVATKYSIPNLIEKYPKTIGLVIVTIFGLLASDNVIALLKLLGFKI